MRTNADERTPQEAGATLPFSFCIQLLRTVDLTALFAFVQHC